MEEMRRKTLLDFDIGEGGDGGDEKENYMLDLLDFNRFVGTMNRGNVIC